MAFEYPPQQSKASWNILHDFLTLSLESLGKIDYKVRLSPLPSGDPKAQTAHLEGQWQVPYSECRDAIERGFQAFLETGAWGEMTEREKYYARWAVLEIQDFLGLTLTDSFDADSTIFPFPEADYKNVAAWLVEKWFFHRGMKRAASREVLNRLEMLQMYAG